MTISSGVQQFDPYSFPELLQLMQQGHTNKTIVVQYKILYGVGASGQPQGKRPPDGLHVALSGICTTGKLLRAKVGVAGYVQWANDATVYANYLYDKDGFWVVIDVDSDCTVDFFQVDWMVYWL